VLIDYSLSKHSRPNKALQQNCDDIFSHGSSSGCDLLKAAVKTIMAFG
jgi:hypothetical protein